MAASLPLIATKLHVPPRRPHWIARPRLLEKLALEPDTALVLVSAPAGFGKTTLLADWAHAVEGQGSGRVSPDKGDNDPAKAGERSRREPASAAGWASPDKGDNDPAKAGERSRQEPTVAVAWVSLDEGDNDPARFLRYLLSALGQALGASADLQPAAAALSTAAAAAPNAWEGCMAYLINELERSGRECLLVLDDYHSIHSPAVHSAVGFLLERRPSGFHLALGSRSTPPLPLARLQSRGQMIELRAADLRFTPAEAASYLAGKASLNLNPAQAESLAEICEGWAAGLQLAAVSLQGRADPEGFVASFSGQQRAIVAYLMDEVFAQQPEPVRLFLLQTSILERLCAPLCAAVMGDGQAVDAPFDATRCQEILEYLERSNLFTIPLDETGHWYRYHRLFAGALRSRFERGLLPGAPSLSLLHRRAAGWLAGEGLLPEAVEHALAIPDEELAAGLVERAADGLLARGESDSLAGWLSRLPEACLAAHPRLQVAWAWLEVMRGDLPGMELHLAAAEAGAAEAADAVQGRVAAVRAFQSLSQRDPAGTIRLAETALQLLPAEDRFWRGIAARVLGEARLLAGDLDGACQAIIESSRISLAAGDLYQGLSALSQAAGIQAAQGQLRLAESTCREGLLRAGQEGWSWNPYMGLLHSPLGNLLLEANQLAAAQEHLERALELGRQAGTPAVALSARPGLARLKLAQGDPQAARAEMEALESGVLRLLPPGTPSPFGALKVRYALAAGDLRAALAWKETSGLSPQESHVQGRENEFLSLAMVLLFQGRREPHGPWLGQAQDLLERLQAAAQTAGLPGLSIEVQLNRALVEAARGQPHRALPYLEQALDAPEGYLRVFLDEGEPLFSLLKALSPELKAGKLAGITERLMAEFGQAQLRPETSSPASRPPAPFTLEPLSARELEVLRLVARGASNGEIAGQLFVSLATVKSHVNHIMNKLAAQNRTEAVDRARQLGLL